MYPTTKKFKSLPYFGHIFEKIANVIIRKCTNLTVSFKIVSNPNKCIFNPKDNVYTLDRCRISQLSCPKCNAIYLHQSTRLIF